MILAIFLSAAITAANPAGAGAAVISERNSGVAVAPERAARLTLLASHRPVSGDRYLLTPTELQLAKERGKNLEEARDANVAARNAARQAENNAVSMEAQVIDTGLLLTFGDRSFVSHAELSSAARRRLDALVGFLLGHPDSAIKFRLSAGHVSEANAQQIAARAAALKRYLAGAGIEDDRFTSTRVGADATSDERNAVQLVVEDSNIPQ